VFPARKEEGEKLMEVPLVLKLLVAFQGLLILGASLAAIAEVIKRRQKGEDH
jgi:hypothetical protein